MLLCIAVQQKHTSDIKPGRGAGDGFACGLVRDKARDNGEYRPDGDEPPPVEPDR